MLKKILNKFYLKFLLIISIFLIFFSDTEILAREVYFAYKRKLHSTLYLTTGLPILAKSGQFFDFYSELTGGEKNDFESTAELGGGVKFQLFRNFRLGLGFSFFESKFHEGITQNVEGKDGERILDEDFRVRSMPVSLIAEYVPYMNQFRSYVGIGIGANITNIIWEERVNSTIPGDRRRSGTPFNESLFEPNFRFYSGFELGFDDRSESDVFASLIFEFVFDYSPRNAKFFKDLELQFSDPPEKITEEFSIIPWSFSINVGVAIEFVKQNRSPDKTN